MWSRESLCSKNKEVSTFVFYIHRNHIHFPKVLFKILKAQLPVQDNKSSPDYISFNSGSLRSSFHAAWAAHAHCLTSRGSIKTNAETRSVWVPFLPDRCDALTIGCRIYGFYNGTLCSLESRWKDIPFKNLYFLLYPMKSASRCVFDIILIKFSHGYTTIIKKFFCIYAVKVYIYIIEM